MWLTDDTAFLTAHNFLDPVVCLVACPNHTRTPRIKRSKLPEEEIPEDQEGEHQGWGSWGGGSACDNPIAKACRARLLAGFSDWGQGLDALPTQMQTGHAGVPNRPQKHQVALGPPAGRPRSGASLEPYKKKKKAVLARTGDERPRRDRVDWATGS